MKNQTFIALDIETTGFNVEKDQIIEIGAIRFERSGKIIDTFDTTLNPKRPIPAIITHITGIKDSDLQNSPTLADITKDLQKFLRKDPIVGHNISFDLNFLNGKGLNINNDLYDTLQLSSILLPGLPSYSLDTLTRILEIKHKNKHRALSDTVASKDLFMILLDKIAEIDPQTFDEIDQVLKKSQWPLKPLFSSQAKQSKKQKKLKTRAPKSKSQSANNEQQLQPHPAHPPLPKSLIKDFFKPDGPLAKTISEFETRDSQIQISEKINQAFTNNSNLIIEAGTGTGKTVAYLLAAYNHSRAQNSRVVISTYTKHLQEQILDKDIPQLEKALRQIDPEIKIKATVLKGRRNYISLKRLHFLLTKDFFQDHEVTFLIKVLNWLNTTQTGELGELSLQNKEFTLLDEVCCDEITNEESDPEYANRCFLKKARLKAEQSDMIIVNHSLALIDAIQESAIIPEYDCIIFDEAHNLEKVATETLSINLSFNFYIKPFDKLAGLINSGKNPKELKPLSVTVNNVISRTEIFFGLLGIFIEKFTDPSQYFFQNLINEPAQNSLEWKKVKESAQILKEFNNELLNDLENTGNLNNDLFREIKNIQLAIEERQDAIKTLFLTDEWKERITWTYKTMEGANCIKSAPLIVGDTMKKLFYDRKNSIILLSATLRTDHSFDYIRRQLSLYENFEEIALPSHFSYPDQVKIIIPQDMPRPNTEGYFSTSTKIITNIIRKNGGRTLVLFTSKKALQASYMSIAPSMKEEGFSVLAQGISGGKGKILEQFKREPETSALFGTDSFWEGIDIPGDLLTCVVIQKLPFDPPTDPMIVMRGQMYTDSFNEYQIPRAILKFKQGFGRLIRTSKDKGSMVLLDSRISQSSYGPQFLASLPEGIKILHCNSSETASLL